MSVREIRVGCDTPDCYAFYTTEDAESVDAAREFAAERWGWAYGDTDICAPCQRRDTPDQRQERP